MAYDEVGNMTSVKNPMNKTTTYAYNDMGWLTAATNPLGYQTKYSYDGNGNVEKIERQKNTGGTLWQTTEYTYTTTQLLRTITNALSKVTTYNYDANRNLSSIVDAEADTTRYSFDERNLLWKMTDALGKVTEYSYNENGGLASIEDPNGSVTTYSADEYDRLLRMTYDDSSYERVALDRNGNVDSLFVNGSLQALYDWDAQGRLRAIAYADGDTTAYTYNKVSQLIQAVNALSTLTYTYDALGRLDSMITVVDGHTYGVGYDYDKNSNRTRLNYPSTYNIDFSYTDIDQMDEIKRAGLTLVNYDYDTLGRRVFREMPADLRFIQSFYEYDGADHTTRVLNKTLRPTGGEDEPEPGWSMRGMWRRLTNWMNRPAWAGTGITISDYTYTYDDVGNRLTMSVDGGNAYLCVRRDQSIDFREWGAES
jgi:YD repeat-containing protein